MDVGASAPSGTMNASQNYHDYSEEDDLDAALSYPEQAAMELSPQPPELPTWDTVPFSNLPEVLGSSSSSGYELRPGPRIEAKATLSTWLDQDGTATYSPDCKLDPYLHPPAEIFEGIKSRRAVRFGERPTRPSLPKTLTWQQGRYEGKRLPLTLSFKTQKGRESLASYGTSLDNWPKSAWRPPDEVIDWESWWDAVLMFEDDDSPESSSGRRDRPRTNFFSQKSDENAKVQPVEEITLGHPEARGCKGCFELGQRCPLLDEGSKYPCDICIEDGCDCELILEPAKKRGCLNCGRRRISCSYREANSDHSLPCSDCAQKGLQCIAGPASGRTRTGPALDSVLYSQVHTIRKAFARCRQSSKPNRRRTLEESKKATTRRDRHPKPPEGDKFEAVPGPTTRAEHASKTVAGFGDPLTTDSGLQQEDTQFIRTQLAHPICLNRTDPPCHWCQDIGYGIMGLGPPREVEILDMNDGAGYIEVEGGYVSAGAEASRMCTECTMDRLQIAACLQHNTEDLSEIEGIAMDTFDPNYVMEFLMPGMAVAAPFAWCRVCTRPAFYACCKPTDKDVQDLLGMEGTKPGCGLKLCSDCAETLVLDVGGNLDTLVRTIKEQNVDDVFLRADVDLILRDGEVVRRLGWVFTLGDGLA